MENDNRAQEIARLEQADEEMLVKRDSADKAEKLAFEAQMEEFNNKHELEWKKLEAKKAQQDAEREFSNLKNMNALKYKEMMHKKMMQTNQIEFEKQQQESKMKHENDIRRQERELMAIDPNWNNRKMLKIEERPLQAPPSFQFQAQPNPYSQAPQSRQPSVPPSRQTQVLPNQQFQAQPSHHSQAPQSRPSQAAPRFNSREPTSVHHSQISTRNYRLDLATQDNHPHLLG